MADVNLNTKVRFDQRDSAQDAASGAQVASWTPYATRWAELVDVPAIRIHERIEQNLRLGERLSKLRLRYCEDITPEMRATDLRTGRVMKLLSPGAALDGEREWTEFLVADFSTAGDAQ